MGVHGVLMVRDGVDTLRVCLLHHLSFGLERIWVVDNGSTDGTDRVLERLARKLPIAWTRDAGAYRQHEVVSALTHEATRAGAKWVVPLDHDEFWAGPLHEVLASVNGAAAVEAPMVTFAQRREQAHATPRGLLTMNRRVPDTVEPVVAQERVEAGELSFLEYEYPPKLVFRASTEVEIARGAHWAMQLNGDVAAPGGLEILHAPLRARSCLELKAEHGERLVEAGYIEREGWHVRRWAHLAREGRLDPEWAALSYDAAGRVHRGREPLQLVRDDRLVRAVGKWIRPRVKQAAARALRRSW